MMRAEPLGFQPFQSAVREVFCAIHCACFAGAPALGGRAVGPTSTRRRDMANRWPGNVKPEGPPRPGARGAGESAGPLARSGPAAPIRRGVRSAMNPQVPAASASISSSDVRRKHKEFLFPAVTNYYEEPIVLAEGKGMRVRDLDGREYLDFFGGILTVSVGHCNDEVNAAVNKHALSPYCYRCPLGLTYPSCEVKCARDIEELIRTTTTGQIAGFLAEPIQGVGGFVTPPKEYFQIAVEIVRRYGGVFICDEVQTGFARTGGKW